MFLLYISPSFLQTPITNTSSLLLPVCSPDKTSNQRTYTSTTKYQFLFPNLQLTCTSPHSLYLPSYCNGWTAFSPCTHPPIFTCNLGLLRPIWLPHDSCNQWFVFHILSFGSFAWAHSFIEAKITRKKPFFNPIFLSSYHPFLCSSSQQNSCKTCLHTWSPLPFLPISLEAIGDFVPTNLHWNPLDTVRWSLPTTTPLLIQWPILSTCLTSL